MFLDILLLCVLLNNILEKRWIGILNTVNVDDPYLVESFSKIPCIYSHFIVLFEELGDRNRMTWRPNDRDAPELLRFRLP